MNTNQYTQKTLEALQAAQQLAVEYQHNALEPEHLLHALASQEQGLIPQLLQKMRPLDIDLLINAIGFFIHAAIFISENRYKAILDK